MQNTGNPPAVPRLRTARRRSRNTEAVRQRHPLGPNESYCSKHRYPCDNSLFRYRTGLDKPYKTYKTCANCKASQQKVTFDVFVRDNLAPPGVEAPPA
ncbi:hypothetical protein FQN49_004977 [Arthroderma sp. PD_2]|nr:hypothetical protein FQN49_004977 [Arthroderma sp. PD_2]